VRSAAHRYQTKLKRDAALRRLELFVMRDATVIQINITGPVQTGKTAVLASIKALLEEQGYCVAIPDREERNNPSHPIDSAAPHEKPKCDKTVFVLTESDA